MEGIHGENLKKGWEPRCGNSIWGKGELQACVDINMTLCNVAYRWAQLMVSGWENKG